MHFNEALLESMIYALAYVECVAKRYSWPYPPPQTTHLHCRPLSEGMEVVERERVQSPLNCGSVQDGSAAVRDYSIKPV